MTEGFDGWAIAEQRIAQARQDQSERLDLGNLGLTQLPASLFELTGLRRLQLGGVVNRFGEIRRKSVDGEWQRTDEPYRPNQIEAFAPEWSQRLRLRQLDCSGAALKGVTGFEGFTELELLDLSFTGVSDLSPLAGLTALQSLDLYDCPITLLPNRVVALPALETLRLSPQPGLGQIPAEVLSQNQRDNCLPRLRAHLADLEAGAESLTELKLIVLGNGRVGKTQICRRLRGEGFEERADSTHGISVTTLPLTLPGETDPTRLHLWDFGGQELYHGTHALFMRSRALFLLVWSPQSEAGEQIHQGLRFRNHPLPYWLAYIRHLGGADSPVILLQNRCDGGLGEALDLPSGVAPFLAPLQQMGRFITRVAYSAKDRSGHDRLLAALAQGAQSLYRAQGRPQIGRNRLAVWRQLQQWQDEDARRPDPATRRHRLLPYTGFAELCDRHGVQSPETFVEVLHHAGVVYYQRGCFGDRLLLDQSWALSAIYALFTREGQVYTTLQRLGGRFTRGDLERLLWGRQGFSSEDQQLLLGMMAQSGICFRHRWADGEAEYVAPELLPVGRAGVAEALAARWEPLPGDPLTARRRLPFLSPALPRELLSALGGQAGDSALYWRYGLCLYDSGRRASALIEVLADEEERADGDRGVARYGGEIRVQCKGGEAQGLLAALMKQIERLDRHGEWGGAWLPVEGEAGAADSRQPRGEGGEAWPAPRGASAETTGDGRERLFTPGRPPALPTDQPEIYLSYSWSREREAPLVEALCDALAGRGWRIQRDQAVMQPGDRISEFMDRLSAGRCVVVVISAAYLRSEFCMTELLKIWHNTRQRDDAFLARIIPLVQEDAKIGTIEERISHAVYWRKRYEKLAALVDRQGASLLGPTDFQRFKLIGQFYTEVGELLAYVDDLLVPRDRTSLAEAHFAVIEQLVERALTLSAGDSPAP